MAVALALAACGGGTAPATPPITPGASATPREVNIVMRDYGYVPPVVDLVPGETVTLHVVNGGLEIHEAVVGDLESQLAWEAAEDAVADHPPGPTPVVAELPVSGRWVGGDPGPAVVDLGGRCVVPGFTDAHVHFPTWALAQRQVRLEGCSSRTEAVSRVADAAAGAAPGAWLVGYGWRNGDWVDPSEPTRHDLDPVTPGLKVALWSRDDHSVVSSKQ